MHFVLTFELFTLFDSSHFDVRYGWILHVNKINRIELKRLYSIHFKILELKCIKVSNIIEFQSSETKNLYNP